MNFPQLAWYCRAELLAHDFKEREKDLIEIVILNSFDCGRAEAPLTAGFGQWTGRREDEERRTCAALARAGVLVWDGQTARLLPDATKWKIRRKLPTVPTVPAAVQTELLAHRPLDAALASVSAEQAQCSERFAQLRRTVDSPPDPKACADAKMQSPAKLSSAQAQALGCTQDKPKAKLSSEDVAIELRRSIGEQAWNRYREWADLVRDDPEYVRGLLAYADAVQTDTGKPLRSVGGYLSRIARDDKRWPAREPAQG